MAAPNIVNVTSIFGKTATANVTTISSNVVENIANSNAVFKINNLIISNIEGTNPAAVTASLFKSGIENKIAHTVTVPADATLVILSKDTALYLEENTAIRVAANSNSFLWAVCSYEEIS